jgi:CubicO group peptidase (beta-lactamase class C family)
VAHGAARRESAHRRQVHARASHSHAFSGSVLVARGDDVVFSGGYGYADIERGIRNDVETQYRIGSVTKPFTATRRTKFCQRRLERSCGRP